MAIKIPGMASLLPVLGPFWTTLTEQAAKATPTKAEIDAIVDAAVPKLAAAIKPAIYKANGIKSV